MRHYPYKKSAWNGYQIGIPHRVYVCVIPDSVQKVRIRYEHKREDRSPSRIWFYKTPLDWPMLYRHFAHCWHPAYKGGIVTPRGTIRRRRMVV